MYVLQCVWGNMSRVSVLPLLQHCTCSDKNIDICSMHIIILIDMMKIVTLYTGIYLNKYKYMRRFTSLSQIDSKKDTLGLLQYVRLCPGENIYFSFKQILNLLEVPFILPGLPISDRISSAMDKLIGHFITAA